MVRLLVVFVVAFCLGGYASLHVLSEYVFDIKEHHDSKLEHQIRAFKHMKSKSAESLIENSNMLARYSVCELDSEEGQAIAAVLSMNSFHLGSYTIQSSQTHLDVVLTGLLLSRELKGSTPKKKKLDEIIGKYCQENHIKCEKFDSLSEEKLIEFQLKCT
ncbi:hypothetical protein AB6D73_13565 [Vibrio splendidus]